MLKIASWNVNSLNVRLPHVMTWVNEHKPDILALQETKLIDEKFPLNEFRELGYNAIYTGQKSYNGVAILSSLPADEIVSSATDYCEDQKRITCATIKGIRIINLYVPNGEHVASQKYEYKLSWLMQITDYIRTQIAKYDYVAVVGDFNIAPGPEDVHNPVQWENKVMCSLPEREAFSNLLNCGLKDAFRLFPQPEKSFTWWDYRMQAVRRNWGLRIDHILVNQALATKCLNCVIDKAPRQWERPSDHAPISATFAL